MSQRRDRHRTVSLSDTADMQAVKTSIIAEFYAPRCDTRVERREALRRLEPRIRRAKWLKKSLRRRGMPTRVIDFEYTLLAFAATHIQQSGYFLEPGGGGGVCGCATYDEARAWIVRGW